MRVDLRRGVVAVALVLALAWSWTAPTALAGRGEAGTVQAGNLLRVEVQGGPGSGFGYAGVTQDTRLGDSLFVSNQPTAYNRVLVRTRAASATPGLQATVTNLDGAGQPLVVPLTQGALIETVGGVSHHWYDGVFHVVPTAPGQAQVQAADGNRIRVSYATSQVLMTVDGTPPTISNFTPIQDLHSSSPNITFSGIIRDFGSGMRSDHADHVCAPGSGGPGCSSAVSPFGERSVPSGDANQNGITVAEPRMFLDGIAADIRMRLVIGQAGSNFSVLSGDLTWEVTQEQGWRRDPESATLANLRGFQFTLPVSLPVGPGAVVEYHWLLQARDRAGNMASAERTIFVDRAAPRIALAEWGIGYDSGQQREVEDARSIRVTFVNAGGIQPETLNPASVIPSFFTVSGGHAVEQAVFVAGPGPDGQGDAVYLHLSEEPDPGVLTVSVTGGIRDMAGNIASPHSLIAENRLLPNLTVTMTGANSGMGGLPAARGEDPGEELIVRVTSDRPLATDPRLFIQHFVYDGRQGAAVNSVKLRSVREVIMQPAPGAPLTWQARLDTVEAGGPGLFGVWITALDPSGEVVTTGNGGTAADSNIFSQQTVDLTKVHLGIIDTALVPHTVQLAPAEATTTQSTSPYVFIDFAEATQYGIERAGQDFAATDQFVHAFDCGAPSPNAAVRCVPAPGSTAQVGSSPVRVDLGAGRRVELASVTLDGVDVSSRVARRGDASFLVSLSGLSLGEHTLRFNARDSVGNTYATARTFVFTVEERGPFRVPLSAGWNLVSLPGRPVDSDIDDVFPAGHPATVVMGYLNGEWLVAARGPNGAWEGTLPTISGSLAYWVYTTTATTIETLLGERGPADPAPAFPVRAGWNLVPVFDVTQAPAGGPPGGGPPVTAADYFASIDWDAAYSYDASRQTWVQVMPSNGSILNGRGYWVYVRRNGLLVP